MTEPNQAQTLMTTLRDALRQLDVTLGRTREGVNEIASQVERLQTGVEALGAQQQREATAVGIDMLVDAAADFLAAFRELESGLLDAQADVDMLAAASEDDADGREA